MTRLTTADLTPFYRNTIGIDNILNRVINQMEANNNGNGTYPPYNIIKTAENSFEVQVAIAGFTPGEVTAIVQEGVLIISGEKSENSSEKPVEYIHHGISSRRFIRTFSLADRVEVVDAVATNGILSVRLERIIPEESKPKNISITYIN
jgi:molecular chaperone IbpA